MRKGERSGLTDDEWPTPSKTTTLVFRVLKKSKKVPFNLIFYGVHFSSSSIPKTNATSALSRDPKIWTDFLVGIPKNPMTLAGKALYPLPPVYREGSAAGRERDRLFREKDSQERKLNHEDINDLCYTLRAVKLRHFVIKNYIPGVGWFDLSWFILKRRNKQ